MGTSSCPHTALSDAQCFCVIGIAADYICIFVFYVFIFYVPLFYVSVLSVFAVVAIVLPIAAVTLIIGYLDFI